MLELQSGMFDTADARNTKNQVSGTRWIRGETAELNVALGPVCTDLIFQQRWNTTIAPLDVLL